MAETTTVPGDLEQALRSAFDLVGNEKDRAIWRGLADHVLTGSTPSEMPMGEFNTLVGFGLIDKYAPHMHPELVALTRFVVGLDRLPYDVVHRWISLLGAVLSTMPEYGLAVQFDPNHGIDALLVQLAALWPEPDEGLVVGLDHLQLEQLLVAWRLDPAQLMVWAFRGHLSSPAPYLPDRCRVVRALRGYDDAVRRHTDVVRASLVLDTPDEQQMVLDMLLPLSADTLVAFAPEIARIALSSAEKVRIAAEPLLVVEGVADQLRSQVDSAKPAQRIRILKVLWATNDLDQQRWASERAAADRAASVRALAAVWEANETASDDDSDEVPAPVSLRVRMTPELREELRLICAEGASFEDRGRRLTMTDDELQPVLDTLESGVVFGIRPEGARLDEWWVRRVLHDHVVSIGPVVTTVLLARTNLLHPSGGLSNEAMWLYQRCYQATGRPEPLEIAQLLDAVGVDGRRLVTRWDRASYFGLRDTWPVEAIAPFASYALTEYLALLESSETWYSDDDAIFHALESLPEMPPEGVDALARLGLRQQKTYRRESQDLLANVPGIGERIVDALGNSQAGVRAVAAEWLQRLAYPQAVPALEAALTKEKNDLAKAAFLDALQAFGRPVEKYVDRDALLHEANRAVAKGVHKDIQWLTWDSLPTVHWADTGDVVPLPVLQWLVNQAVKAKSPEPGALLRTYAGLFVPGERNELGRYLLTAWIAQDTKPISQQEAWQLAAQDAGWWHNYLNSQPQNYVTGQPIDISGYALAGLSRDEMIERLLPDFLRQPAGSAIASKGLLAVVAACSGEAVGAITAPYLKEWYGTRAAQCKALVVMLAWTEHPSATQVMLAVASRFRTKGIQEEAVQQAAALAERKGWTLDELADRTVPYAGFDEDGRLELSFGSRAFVAELQTDLTVGLTDPEGKRIKALPAPRQSDDEAEVQSAKKAFSAAKRELKTIVQAQTNRLYEALCTGRTWTAADWQLYLNEHPILRRLVQRLAWLADGTTVFRPLDDGSLTDADDNPVKLAPDSVITLAHDTLLPDDVVSSWQQHFADYEVVPLFVQFGRGRFKLPAEQAGDKALRDFEGHLVEAFALRGRATKLGYTRGETGDGAWFYSYEKRLLSLGLTVELNFTGNTLPEENNTVALTELAIRSTTNRSAALRLADVPPVLLAEAYNDLRHLAADGTGFDPNWQTKTGR
ncbi:DUF4132 domain-containing protein [Kribbella sp. NBC_01505]|uniref:DUF4132 domain-containing protein n=1 Tax=Kribbella sp. NBC_01505 TaxID=2903580 RepID=UPI00386F4ABA